MDEASLVAQAKQDRQAFGVLYDCYVDRIYSYMYYRTSNVADAEDLTARVFFKALEHIGDYEDRGYPFSAWLFRIAHNLVANWYRDNSRRQVVHVENLSRWHFTEQGPEDMAVLLDDKEALMQAIQALPADRQELLILKFVDQLTNAEIGAVLGRSEGAIKSLYYRTLMALREEMQPHIPRFSRFASLLRQDK